MPNRIKGITVEIGGDTQGLDKALKGVNDTGRNLQKELRDVQRLLKFDPSNTELLAQKQELLGQQVGNTEEKLKALREAEAQVQRQFESGEIGAEQYRAFQRELQQTEGYLRDTKRKYDAIDDSNAAEEAADDVNKLKKAADRAGDSLKKMGGGMTTAAKGIAGAAAAGAAGIGGLVAGTQELNQDLARLRFNAGEAGFNIGGVEEGFKKIAAVSGETDSAVETLSNLMQTGFDDEQLSQVIDNVNGAAVRFSDTLKTEGIADGLQETFATGKAIGQFGELLERSGVNLDEFNAGLAEAQAQGKETDYVLQTMSDLGLAEAGKGFKDMNKDLMAQQEAQLELQMSLAALGEALTPLATMVTEFLTAIADWSLENIELVKSFDSISEGIVALLPQLFGSGLKMITTIVQAIVDNLPMILEAGTTILMELITGIIEMIPILVVQIQKLLPLVSSILKENLPLIIEAGIELLIALLNGIVSMLPQLIQLALDLIVLISQELLKHLPEILEAGVEIIFALIDGLISMIPEIIHVIVFDIIPAIIDTLAEVQLSDVGEDIMQGLIDGLWNMAGAVWEAAKDIASGIGDKIAGILQLGSPSKLMEDYGEFTGEGLEIGMKNSLGQIKKMAQNMAEAAVPESRQMKVQEEMNAGSLQAAASKNNMTVNIHSPKALDAREANLLWSRTMKKMQLQW
jgi:hypothetical protein